MSKGNPFQPIPDRKANNRKGSVDPVPSVVGFVNITVLQIW